jgi:hypothetical protein
MSDNKDMTITSFLKMLGILFAVMALTVIIVVALTK